MERTGECSVIKRDELANPNSCLNRAGDDEPIFVLRAHDPDAAAVVLEWADRYLRRKIDANYPRVLTPEQRMKWGEANELVENMQRWHDENVK